MYKLLIVGVLFLVPTIGCKSTHSHDSSWGNEMASNAAYAAPQPTSSYAPPAAAAEWVCPMHPSIRQSQPGKCSICGMGLVRSGGPSNANGPPSGSGHSGSSGCSSCGG